jgi:hypothetical protein
MKLPHTRIIRKKWRVRRHPTQFKDSAGCHVNIKRYAFHSDVTCTATTDIKKKQHKERISYS